MRDLAWDHGESAVWEVASRAGRAVLKAHGQRRKYEQELTANRDWLPALRALALPSRTPVLLGWRTEAPWALLFEYVPGRTLLEAAPEPDQVRELHRRAGAFLAALHALDVVDEDPLPLADAFVRRLEEWSRRARGILPDAVIANVGGRAREAVPALRQLARRPCHRDYTPRNWLVGPADELSVIDFEHARPDLYLVDFERMFSGLWRRQPELSEAFMEGYGRPLSGDELELLERTSPLAALSTVVWAREHGDEAFEAHGRDILSWLGAADASA